MTHHEGDKAPLTGCVNPTDVLRHVALYGPARNEAERDELLAALSEDKPTPKGAAK